MWPLPQVFFFKVPETLQQESLCVYLSAYLSVFTKNIINLAKLDDGLAVSPTVMVVETKNNKKLCKNRGILKPSWAFVETDFCLHTGTRDWFLFTHWNSSQRVVSVLTVKTRDKISERRTTPSGRKVTWSTEWRKEEKKKQIVVEYCAYD
jgi:hypothetical protein